MDYHDAIAKLRDHGPLIGAQLRYNVADGLPLLTDLQPCFDQLREWLHGGGVGHLLRNWEGVDQLKTLVERLDAGRRTHRVALFNPLFADEHSMAWHALRFSDADGVLSLIVTIDDADAANALPADIVTAGLLLLAVAAVTGRTAGELVLNVGSLTLGAGQPVGAVPLVRLSIVPPGRGLVGLLGLERRDVLVGRVAA